MVNEVRLLSSSNAIRQSSKNTHKMKINYQHKALEYCNPLTGEYDENEEINPKGILVVDSKYEVCTTCNGHGSHFRSDLDENNLVDNMREDGDDEGIEAYYQGAYDQVCDECHGKRVVANPTLPAWAENRIYDWYESELKYRAICRAEQSVGA